MTTEPEGSTPRLTGEAAWKAELDATEQRNAAARRRAHETKSPTELATDQRERRMAVLETAQLNALNKRIDSRSR